MVPTLLSNPVTRKEPRRKKRGRWGETVIAGAGGVGSVILVLVLSVRCLNIRQRAPIAVTSDNATNPKIHNDMALNSPKRARKRLATTDGDDPISSFSVGISQIRLVLSLLYNEKITFLRERSRTIKNVDGSILDSNLCCPTANGNIIPIPIFPTPTLIPLLVAPLHIMSPVNNFNEPFLHHRTAILLH
ncbi:hypothetical protein K435DRAFT_887399 [Dendrothele bispora CBS 962.96]|uniref:Uncharacterized protein n=1 Tax=Dendrothele bispora (strain CBS 962.96) TaxID=1314807 RepID=A0A4S8KS65_DENBC|nr:hypothetical protein K435DRAFT_887399 [Dendrothele bispora CBS 962.96]